MFIDFAKLRLYIVVVFMLICVDSYKMFAKLWLAAVLHVGCLSVFCLISGSIFGEILDFAIIWQNHRNAYI